jgi:mRNA interferase MazF
MNRGDIYWVEIPNRIPTGREIAKTRPCVIVSVAALNKARSTVVMVPLTSNNKTYPPIAIAVPSAGINSVAVCDQVFAVDKLRLSSQKGQLDQADLELLDESLRLLMGL